MKAKSRTVRYFSQHGEDYLLSEFFAYKKHGFFVDVGAFDGVYLSNSLSFEQQGWQGIAIEPNPVYFQLCEQTRPNTICLHYACVGQEHTNKVVLFTEETGVLSGLTSDTQHKNGIRRRYKRLGREFKGFEQVEVPARTLNSILDEHVPVDTALDFISIDVEGTELDVLEGFDLARHVPRVIVVEANSPEEKAKLDAYLITASGYHFARSVSENHFYTLTPKDAEHLRRIAINCRVEPNIHPKGELYTPPAYVKGVDIKEKQTSVVWRVLRRSIQKLNAVIKMGRTNRRKA